MTPILVRFTTAALVAGGAASSMVPQAARAGDPIGTWQTEDGRARVRTEHCGPKGANLCGYVVWLQKPLDDAGKPRVDKFNSDERKQTRPALGHQMLLGLNRNDEGRFEGKIYNADNGKSYDVTVWSDAPTALTVKGCMLVFCASQAWKRVPDTLPGQLHANTDLPGGPQSDPEWTAKPITTGTVPGDKRRSGTGAVHSAK